MGLERYLADADARYGADRQMLGAAKRGPGYHTQLPDGAWSHATRESLDYALALLRAGEPWRADRAAVIVRRVLALQDTDPTSPTYGIWPWYLEEPLAAMAPPDWNWADFCGARLAQLLVDHAGALPDDLLPAVRAGLGHAAWSIFRRNVGPGYTNIAIMGAGVALAAGALLAEPRLADYGRLRFRQIVEHTEYHGGFNEYNSPTYTLVALHECERTLHLVGGTGAPEAEWLRRKAWQTVAEHFHPGTEQWAGPHSRAYGDRLGVGIAHFLTEQTGVLVRPHPAVAPGGALDLVPPQPCPTELVDRFRALPGPEVEIRRRFVRREEDGDGEDASTWGTTWLAEDACLGTVNRDSLWTQRRVLLGYWRTADDPAVVLRLRFLHDGHDFASAIARTTQHGNRALTTIGLLTDQGDFHPKLDRPVDGTFAAEDFRVRYELIGSGVAASDLGDNRFALAAGPRQAVIHALPGRFGASTLTWELGGNDERRWLDGVCYRGPRRQFDPAAIGDMTVVAGVELLGMEQAPASASPAARGSRPGVVEATWPVGDGLRITAPTRAEPYP